MGHYQASESILFPTCFQIQQHAFLLLDNIVENAKCMIFYCVVECTNGNYNLDG